MAAKSEMHLLAILDNTICTTTIRIPITRWGGKRLKGCIFSPPPGTRQREGGEKTQPFNHFLPRLGMWVAGAGIYHTFICKRSCKRNVPLFDNSRPSAARQLGQPMHSQSRKVKAQFSELSTISFTQCCMPHTLMNVEENPVI